MSNFAFDSKDFNDKDSFIKSVGKNQVNKTIDGKPVALRTTASEKPPRKTLSVVDISNAMTQSVLFKDPGVSMDIYSRVGQDVIATTIAEHGGPQKVLGGTMPIAVTDMVIKAERTEVTPFSIDTGNGPVPNVAAGGLNMGDFPPPPADGGYRSNDEMRKAWSIGGMTPPHGGASEGIIIPFTWWNGITYQVNKGTVPVWRLVDSIMKKWNYGPRKEETGGGAYNRRKITGGSGWSLHAYGIAVDINPTKNPYGPSLITDMPGGMITEILKIQTKAGYKCVRWGGHYKRNKDAMHFEVMATPAEVASGITMGGSMSGSTSQVR